MLERLSIITPLSRKENYGILKSNIPSEVEWIIVSDGDLNIQIEINSNTKFILGPNTKSWGDVQRSIGINNATREFIYFLDDDNLIYPFALETAIEWISHYNTDAVLFGIVSFYPFLQNIWFPSNPILKGKVDLGMFLGKRKSICELIFNVDGHFPNFNGERGADFEFLRSFENRFKLLRLPMILGFHNAIELIKSNNDISSEMINENCNLLELINTYLQKINPQFTESD
jgi:glycosyltransferase involved in cell wall biosynthesis